MFSCLQILEAFLWFVIITLLNVTLIIFSLSLSGILKLLLCILVFFLVMSYCHSLCHVHYFDFERIDALNPAIESCGISTLSQSPMLGFHKQMDNRIKLLEEILSFRMQGVEFDNGDMYVDGHKAAS